MAAVLTILGARDSRLEELVRASGRVSTVTWLSNLSTLLDPRAGQPDVLLVDVRQDGKLPGNLPALKQQHPSTNVMLLGIRCRPGVDARGHARRRHRVHRRATESALTSMRRSRGCSASGSQVAGRPGVRVRRRQGWRRHDDDGGQRGDGTGEACQGPDAARRPAPGVRGCGRVPRRRPAVLAGGRVREHASARRRVPEEPGGEDRLGPRSPGVCGSSGEPARGRAAARRGRATRRVPVRIHGPRRAALGPRRCSTVSIR